jgi:hypothetical protein
MTEPHFDIWTDEQCMQLKPMWELCRVRRDAHHVAYRFYNKYNTIVTLPPILIGAILSTISFNPDAVPSGVSAGLAMFITAMSTINSFFGLSKSQEGHRQSYRMFNTLVRDIELNIIRGKEAPKRTFIDFIEYVNEQFAKVVEDAPTLNPEARRLLDTYRQNRVTPFDKLVEGDKEATGYDATMDEPQQQPNSVPLNTVAVDVGTSNAIVSPTQFQINPTALPVTQQQPGSNEFYQQMASNLQGNKRQFTALKQAFEKNANGTQV